MSRSRIALLFVSLVGAAACGARTGLDLEPERRLLSGDPAVGVDDAGPPVAPPTTAVCAHERFRTGKLEVGFIVLLDRSESMEVDGKWDQVTAAITTFAKDPAVADLPVALTLFPRSFHCEADDYAAPDVDMKPLALNAPALAVALSTGKPSGGTPTEPALAGAITYARGLMLGDVGRKISVVLVTDGNPTVCASLDGTIEIASQGAKGSPEVLTYGVGMESSYKEDLGKISTAGGTGAPIILKPGATIAAELISTLEAVKKSATTCALAIPATAGTTPLTAKDVVTQIDDGGVVTVLPRFASAGACGDAAGFFVDGATPPKTVTLCPSTCADLGKRPDAEVVVIAGCGGQEIETPPADGGVCPSVLNFSCVATCGDAIVVQPECVGGAWACPDGTVSTKACNTCPVEPHGCCRPDGSLAVASCIAGQWECPPSSIRFGESGCSAPAQCAPTLPCPTGLTCVYPDHGCDQTTRVGTCQAAQPCDGASAACGCDKITYPSECAARAAGVDIAADKPCVAPAGTFDCGPLFCKQGTEQCRRIDDLTQSLTQTTWACIPKVSACCSNVSAKCPIGCGCDACQACGPTCVGLCSGPVNTITCTKL